MDGVDDGLALGLDVLDTFVEIEDPAQRLLGWRDVVRLRAKDDNRRADVAEVDPRAIGRALALLSRACCQ